MNRERFTSSFRSKQRARVVVALFILGGVTAGSYATFKYFYPTLDFHVRLSVEIDQQGQRETGSSVIEAKEVWGPTFGLISGVETHLRGEAAYLNLGQGKNLFALLSEDFENIITDIYFRNVNYTTNRDIYNQEVTLLAKSLNKSITLTGPRMPLLVRFQRLDDRKSIEAVDPKNLTAVYGQGVSFVRATLQVVNDPVSTAVVSEKLPWLRAFIENSPNRYYWPSADLNIPRAMQDRVFFSGFVRG